MNPQGGAAGVEVANDLLRLPGIPIPRQQAALIWRELAMGRWRIVSAADRAGTRQLAVTRTTLPIRIDWGCLSAREHRVLALASSGKPQKVIAIELRLSPSTVSQVLRTVRERFALRSFAQLAGAYRAREHGSSSGLSIHRALPMQDGVARDTSSFSPRSTAPTGAPYNSCFDT
jgi:DNA-binding CsgD family transcriptional regulator